MSLDVISFENPVLHCDIRTALLEQELVVKALPDGTVFHFDARERMVFAEYATGVQVGRREGGVFLKDQDGSHWFGDSEKQWFRLN